jgi:putative exporter of polyketide antibiotics
MLHLFTLSLLVRMVDYRNGKLTVHVIACPLCRMKFVAAYLLAVLAGNPNPSAKDLTSILESGNSTSNKESKG